MYLEFHGASEGVTGSLHRVQVQGADIALDCGLFQGHREESIRQNREMPKWATEAKATILSHAHIDHSGNLPSLVKNGFKGNIYCTPPTRDLCSVMLRDSAMLQLQDARYLNRKHRHGKKPIEPLYTVDDVQAAMAQMLSIPLYRPIPVAPGATLTFHNSGHVLGSALVQLDLEENGKKARLLYTGDLGRAELPLLLSPDIVDGVDMLISESTYGDRDHPDLEGMDNALGEVVRTTVERGGRVYIPTFALERAQEVLFALDRLHGRSTIPDVPIYIDSPLAIAITEIYKLHPEVLSDKVRDRILGRDDPFSPPGLHYVSDVEASKALQARHEPCIIIAGSGMCEGGRIVFHLARALEDAKNSVAIVGFQAEHTLGRRLVEGKKKVKVLGLERDVWAKIHTLNGLSAHGDRDDLVRFAKQTAERGHVRKTILVHGETGPKEALKERMESAGVHNVVVSHKGLRVDL